MPAHDIEVHPAAYAELEHARAWYAQHCSVLGDQFVAEVSRAVESVRSAPDTWPLFDARLGVRRYLIHRFPYAIVYRTVGMSIQVIAVMHLRRRPMYWRERAGLGRKASDDHT